VSRSKISWIALSVFAWIDNVNVLFASLKGAYPFAVVIAAWAIVAHFQLFPAYIIPSPFTVMTIFVAMVWDGTLLTYTAVSFFNATVGLVLGASLGILLGFLCAIRRGIYDFFVPLISAVYPVPTIVWVPLALLWFGFSTGSLIFVVFLGCFFNVFYNALAGIRNINPIYVRAARNLNLEGWDYFREVIVWGSFPYLLTGLRLAVGQSWRVIVGAEMLAATVKGLGWFLWISSEFFKYEQVFVGIVMIAIVGLFIERVLFRSVERATIDKWY
jgi:NitT/TauT family transport system permease protein